MMQYCCYICSTYHNLRRRRAASRVSASRISRVSEMYDQNTAVLVHRGCIFAAEVDHCFGLAVLVHCGEYSDRP